MQVSHLHSNRQRLAAHVDPGSAQSAAATLAIERDRRRDELTPDIQVEESTFEDKQVGLWFTNNGPLDYTSVLLRVDPALASPVGAFQIGEAWSTEGDLGPMELGERRLVPIRRNVPMPGTTLRLRLTCENDRGTWTIHKMSSSRLRPWPCGVGDQRLRPTRVRRWYAASS